MPIQLSHLKSQRKQLTVSVVVDESNEELFLAYNPGVITEDTLNDAQKAADTGDGSALNRLLSIIVKEWDLIDENGEPLALIDRVTGGPDKRLNTVPIPFKAMLLREIMEDVRGDPTMPASSSGGGSRRKVK